MAIRVTQKTMYNTMVGQMQNSLGAYMESVQQGATQKKINRPSDDPAGTYRVLTTRVDMTNTAQYQENVDTAKGWLNLADSVLSTNVTTALSGLKALAEQASTGTYDAGQRKIMADQARQYFGQLLNLSNTQFEDKQIFAGHRYDASAFQEGLAVTTWDKDWNELVNAGGVKIEGASDSTILVQFRGEDGPLHAGTKFVFSRDGGENWSDVLTVEDNGFEFVLKADDDGKGVTVTIPHTDKDGKSVTLPNGTAVENIQTKGADEDKSAGANNGTLLYLRPTAIYQGDDNDPPIDVTIMDSKTNPPPTITATGEFGQNVLVRINGTDKGNDVNLKTNPGVPFTWSYSTDGGSTWVSAKGTTNDTGKLRLPIPGGYVDIDAGAQPLTKDSQFLVHPSRADLGYEIMKDTYLSVNSVGKDIFGGYYNGKPALNEDGNLHDNLFEVVGAFIGYLEGNNQEGCQRTLAALSTAEKKVLAEATRIGGMENRLEMAADVLSFQKLDQQERLSYVEDIDLTDLLTKLTRQQMTYQTVLQSSSMIMQMNLAKYI